MRAGPRATGISQRLVGAQLDARLAQSLAHHSVLTVGGVLRLEIELIRPEAEGIYLYCMYPYLSCISIYAHTFPIY